MDKYYSRIFISFLFLLFTNFCFSQATVQFRVSTVYSDVNDMDGFGSGDSDPQWVYQMNDSFGTINTEDSIFTETDCVGTRTVNDVFFSETYNCSLPSGFTFRWRGIEDDSNIPNNINNTDGDAVTSIQNININSAVFNLNQSTWSTYGTYTNTASGDRCPTGTTVTWRVVLQYRIIFSSFLGNGNDTICNAVNLGTLNSGGSLGNNLLSNYSNFCAGNAGDPNSWGGNNDQGVWFQFTTGTNPSSTINIGAKSDPQNNGDGIDLQLALYESSNNICSGSLTLIQEEYQGTGVIWDEQVDVNCLKPNTTYFLLVDGEAYNIITASGQEGYFGLQISDNGITQAADLICDAETLGQVPDGGAVGTPALSRSNICATNTDDPTPTAFTTSQSVWFQFQAPNSGSVTIQANSDQIFPLGTNAIDIQLAVYGTSSGTGNCNDVLVHLNSGYTANDFNENLTVMCLDPGAFYWVLVDGSAINVDGFFDITISDSGIAQQTNDLICNAIDLGTLSTASTIGDNTLSTYNNYCANNLFEPNSWGGNNNQGVWFSFVAGPSASTSIEVTSDPENALTGDLIDLQIALYESNDQTCTGALSLIQEVNHGIGIVLDKAMSVTCLTPGNRYYVLVDGEASIIDTNLVDGLFGIQISDSGTFFQTNDLICDAEILGQVPDGGSVGIPALSSSNKCATNTGDPSPTAFNTDQSVWFQFQAPNSGSVSIQANSDLILIGDPIDLELAVYGTTNGTGNCNDTLVHLGSGYSSADYNENLTVMCLDPGEFYWVLVDGSVLDVSGNFDITISDLVIIQQTNDLICDAEILGQVPDGGSVGTPPSSRSNYCATNTGDPNPSTFNTDRGVWFQFQAPNSGRVLIEVNSDLISSIDPEIAVYTTDSGTGNCNEPLQYLNSKSTLLLNESLALGCLNPGDFYWVLVDGSLFNIDGVFDITISDTTNEDVNTWNGIFWTGGAPNSTQTIVLDYDYDTSLNGNIEACNMIVNTGKTITVAANNHVNVHSNLSVSGMFNILNNGSLVQQSNLGINTGDISYQRNVGLRLLDYVYWSSPVQNYTLNNISPSTPNNYLFKWSPNTNNANGGIGIWENANGDMMSSGKGYIVRGPDGYSNSVTQTLSTTFSGVPNNGIITIPVSRGNYTGLDYTGTNNTTITRFDDNWNLIGNPYPSSINALDFIALNTNIEGAIRLWTHSSLPSAAISDPFYGDYASNYSPTDYITFNSLGAVTGPLGFNGYIAGGQGFFVNMLDGTATTENVTFNNSLRDKTYDNSEFYRQNNTSTEITTISKSRIWLDIVNSNHISDRVLIGYINGATNQKDRLFDAIKPIGNGLKIYSIIEQDKMTIQGRSIPFNEEDRVKIGVNIISNEPYQIAIAATDGIFISDQNIYLEDNELDIVHDLKQSPYTFSSEIGEYNNRFVLRYTNEVLSIENYTEGENIIVVSNDIIQVSSNNANIKEIEVYSILGQLIFSDKNIDTKTYTVSSLQKTNNTLILKIITKNNIPIYKKIIY